MTAQFVFTRSRASPSAPDAPTSSSAFFSWHFRKLLLFHHCREWTSFDITDSLRGKIPLRRKQMEKYKMNVANINIYVLLLRSRTEKMVGSNSKAMQSNMLIGWSRHKYQRTSSGLRYYFYFLFVNFCRVLLLLLETLFWLSYNKFLLRLFALFLTPKSGRSSFAALFLASNCRIRVPQSQNQIRLLVYRYDGSAPTNAPFVLPPSSRYIYFSFLTIVCLDRDRFILYRIDLVLPASPPPARVVVLCWINHLILGFPILDFLCLFELLLFHRLTFSLISRLPLLWFS